MKINKTLKKQIDLLNAQIDDMKDKEIYAIEPDSTWESCYEFKSISFNEKFIWIRYHELYSKKPINTVRITLSDYMAEEDTREAFSWVRRAIKKGIKEQ